MYASFKEPSNGRNIVLLIIGFTYYDVKVEMVIENKLKKLLWMG